MDFEPIGRRAPAQRGESLLQCAQRGGIVLNATCGGEGICGQCLVRIMQGEVSPPSLSEEAELGERLRAGWRLACQAHILGDVRVHIPPESLATTQRLQTEGRPLPIKLAPAVRAVQAHVPPPNLEDLRSDALRLRQALGLAALHIPLPLLRTISDELRRNDFRVSAYIRGSSLVALRPLHASPLGLAIDLGTTKLAGYLVDLQDGKTLATAGVINPQIAYGEDLMARLAHAIHQPGGSEELRLVVVEAIHALAAQLCLQAGCDVADIAEAVVVGNTAMHHLFLGLPVRQLGLAPYVPAESAALDLPARELGLDFATGAYVHLLPNIAGFVGADHVAMLIGSGMLEMGGVVLGLDIGTNTEISLIAHGEHYACSAASGPAFEGAHIQHGMRAAPGAIEKVLIHQGQLKFQTIDHQPPVGICGSGILDLVAQLRRVGLLDARGAFVAAEKDARIRPGAHGAEFVLVSAAENEGREITFSRADVNEIQLAKGAIRAGIRVLLQKAGVEEQAIDAVIIAGAFGTYLDVQSGIQLGMFPNIDRDRYHQVGNAAGTGARMALLSTDIRQKAVEVARGVRYVELTTEKDFTSLFTAALFLA